MIYDRTIADVESAKIILDDFVKKGLDITQAQIDTLERGTLTINTLNRIENKQAELSNMLTVAGYLHPKFENKTWTYTDIFFESDFKRILKNLQILKKAYYVYDNTPDVPEAVYHFSNINDIEKILSDIDELLSNMISYYKECGTVECGE